MNEESNIPALTLDPMHTEADVAVEETPKEEEKVEEKEEVVTKD